MSSCASPPRAADSRAGTPGHSRLLCLLLFPIALPAPALWLINQELEENLGGSGFSLASTLSVGSPKSNFLVCGFACILSLILFKQQPHEQLHWKKQSDVKRARTGRQGYRAEIFVKPSLAQRKIKSQLQWSNSKYLKGYM